MNRPLPDLVQQFGSGRRSGRLMRLAAVLRSNRFTLGCALILAIGVPEIFHHLLGHLPALAGYYPEEPGLLGAIIALVSAHIMLRKIGTLPLVDDKLLILPAFLISYTTTTIALGFVVNSYSRYHLITGFVIGAGWYYFIAAARARLSWPRLALVGDLPLDDELLGTHIEWVQLTRPRIPHNVVGIVFDKHQPQARAWERLFSRAVLRNIPVYELGRLREMVTGRVRLRSRPEEVFGELLPSQPYLRVKRVLDTISAVVALICLSPVIGVAAALIRLESPGPAAFAQRRVGYQGRRFTCYKLRTMRVGLPGPAFTMERDPRITKVGRLLRKWRIDELPQLVNIIKGDMSWIGPRPEVVSLSRDYEASIPFYAYRHAVRPGISGWAQVHQGNVALIDAVTVKLEYDFYYLKYFSIWMDFLIVLRTARTIVTGFGHR